MAIHFSCKQCGSKLKARPEHAGRQTKCTVCQQVQTIPSAAATAPIAFAAEGVGSETSGDRKPASSLASPPVPSRGRRPGHGRKIALFGLMGAVGCLAGWVVGELFLWVAMPTSPEAGGTLASRPVLPPLAKDRAAPVAAPPPIVAAGNASSRAMAPPPSPPAVLAASSPRSGAPLPPPPEFAERLEKARAKSGDVQISLIWFNVNDLDLHCIEPSGEEIFYGRRRSGTGGELDVDMNVAPTTNKPVENIYWPTGKAPTGRYKVYVNHYANHGGRDPTQYKVNILVAGKRQEYSGTISRGQPKRLICEFDVNPPGPELRVAVSPELIVHPGGMNRLLARIARTRFTGPVNLHLDGDLSGLTCRDLVVAEGDSEATIEIAAQETSALGSRNLSLQASADELRAEAGFKLHVKAPPPGLLIAASPELIVNQGGGNRLQVQLTRINLAKPVQLSVQGDLQGISAQALALDATTTEANLDIQAETGAATGERTLTVTAKSGAVAAATTFRLGVQKLPPMLYLAVPDEIKIEKGSRNQLPVRIARERFLGPVTVRLEGDLAGVSPREFTIPTESEQAEVTLLAANDAAVGPREIQVIAVGDGVRAEGRLGLIVAAPVAAWFPLSSWWLILVIGLWTALLVLGLSFALIIGQNWYLARPWISPGEIAALTIGSLAAGITAGGLGQALYGLLTQIRLVPEIGFLAGWLILGSLLGRGVVFFIPNLGAARATIAGSCGGFLGAIAFIATSIVGDLAGRFVGAAILGFAIGLMVALVETAFRKIWLEVEYSPGEVRAVNLGETPILIGGDGRKCNLFVAGAPGRALRFWVREGQVYCLDVVAERTYPVSAGYRHPLKEAVVVVCSSDRNPAPVSSPPGKPKPATPSASTPVATLPPVAARPVVRVPAAAPSPAATPTARKGEPQPLENQESATPVKSPCPVCGKRGHGVPGKRVCADCFTIF